MADIEALSKRFDIEYDGRDANILGNVVYDDGISHLRSDLAAITL